MQSTTTPPLTTSVATTRLRSLLALVLLCAGPAGCGRSEPAPTVESSPTETHQPPEEILVHEEQSEFSRIRIRDRGNLRTLYFVTDSGTEVGETTINRNRPERLVVPYTRSMFASLLLRTPQERVLVIGLGGGAMVRFLNFFFPRTEVDAVEIDPAVVRLAAEYFGTAPGERTRIFTENAFAYLERTTATYDVIYMDAYLVPGAGRDATGKPVLRQPIRFLKGLHSRLEPGGMVAFNMVAGPNLGEELEAIRTSFPTTYLFPVSSGANVVVIGSLEPTQRPPEDLTRVGRRLDAEFMTGFSFEEIARQARPLDSLYRPPR